MAPRNSLKDYLEKRDFQKTREPKGEGRSPSSKPIFVIQKHQARTLHYDFRLEVDGVAKSWAVPKGPSTDPRDKRLAVPTEDHPLDYADFEGIIPKGEYGGGAVLVWDAGTYRNIREEDGEVIPMEQCIADGKVIVLLEGKKLRGGFALIRTRGKEDNRWLLIKMDDDGADARRKPTATEPDSVLSGRSLEQIAEEES
jgi:DNA ligase D-like protein (predicted 3'-phosphoesterase)